jgi:kynurenine formamidase
MTRRDALGLGAKAGAGAVLAWAGMGAMDEAAAEPTKPPSGEFSDEVFDYADPANLSDWAPGPYGPGDQRGSFNEVTPRKTRSALRLVDRGHQVRTYNLGELMFNGFPAFVTTPPRLYEQRLTVLGYEPPPGFVEGGGILQGTAGIGANQVSVHEERFPLGGTYQIATQLDGLNHVGAGPYFYNGFEGPDIAAPFGTTALGNENMGPIVTRGVVLDILGLKLAQGDSAALGAPALNGAPVLLDNYRITLEDISAALERQRVRHILPGDVVIFRTGWNQLLASRDPADFTRWLTMEPGIYLREARFLAAHRPAVIGSDTWALEVLGRPDVSGPNAFPVHQELLMRYGIRIAESVVTDALVSDGVYECVYIVTPQYAEGATAGNTPPAALAQPRR